MSRAEIPNKVGKYDVRGLVGRGAMGVVYSAVDPGLGRFVAIKTMSIAESPHEAELRLRFLREAQAAGRLQHPNIITVHELFEEEDTAYLVMELLEGASLSTLLKRKKTLSLGQKLSIIDQIASGLSEAHAHEIVHRDLKPSNVFVLRSGVVKVLDFGVAKVGEGELTKAGTVFGTVEYMAPEQVRGQVVTPQADIFSLGVVAYEVLSGRNPFRADTLAASVFKIVSDNPGKLTDVVDVPQEIEALIGKALAKPMGERFESLTAFRTALAAAAASANVALSLPELMEEDVVITKDRGDALAMSVEPRVSQWSNVAAEADLLEDVYHRGVASFNEGNYEDCVMKMSQVLDEVPVHSMSLHYLATSEGKLRPKKLSGDALRRASECLTAMRDAHRRGDPAAVTDHANELLAIDPESLEARWYRRNAEARLRASSVGGRASAASASGATSATRSRPGKSRAGTLSRPGGSFGYVPATQGQFGSVEAGRGPELGGPMPSRGTTSGSAKGVWVLGGVALLFVALVGIFLGSSGEPGPAVSADPIQLPGVRTSPFDDLDDDGTVVLHVPQQEPAFTLSYVIPTSILVGEPTTIGLFGSGFPDDASVSIADRSVSIVSTTIHTGDHIEVHLLASEPRSAVEIVVGSKSGYRASVQLAVEP
jgi:serine/threonine protein kinase